MHDFRKSLINGTLNRVLKRLHYPLEVLLTCVRWYVAYPLSLRHVEEMMQERGVFVDHSTEHRWATKMLPVLAAVFRRRKRPVGGSWRMDETSIKVVGQWKYLCRAVHRAGDTVDFLLTAKRDKAAARRFLERAINLHGVPEKITIEKSDANTAAIESVKAHACVDILMRQSKYLNNTTASPFDQRAGDATSFDQIPLTRQNPSRRQSKTIPGWSTPCRLLFARKRMNSLVRAKNNAPRWGATPWLFVLKGLRRAFTPGALGLFLLVLLSAWGLCLPAGAQALRAAPVVDATQISGQPLSLTSYLAVLEDPGQQLTLADVQRPDLAARFTTDPRPAEALNFGITPSAYWLRLALRNAGGQPVPLMLEVAYPRLSHVAFYQPDVQGSYQAVNTGITQPFASRAYPNRFFVFPLTLPAQTQQVYYLRIASTTAFIVPTRLWMPSAFAAHERNDHLSQAWYFGMVTAMVLFNLLLFIGLRERIYLLYVFSCSAVAFALAAQNGLVKAYLWPDTPLWSDLSTTVGYSLTLASAILFMRDMLDTRQLIARMDRWLIVLAGFFLLSPVVFFYSGQTFIKAAAYLYMVAVVAVLGIGLWGVHRRQRSAYFYLGAYAMLLLGAVTNALRSVGLLPTNLFTANALQVGSALEMVLLAFALADRFNAIRQEKARIQSALLQAQETLIDNLKSSERLLEARVAERTEALQALNQQLEVLSSTDALTGLANRRCFDDALEREWQRAIRDGQPLALALLDVDWFKKYNDHFGHPAGDECLRRVAQVLASQVCRSGDLVARFGGEEFIFLAPATSGADALRLAQRICDALQALALPHPGSVLGCVTLSIGVAVARPTRGSAPDGLLKQADEALYRAKAQGRNQALLA